MNKLYPMAIAITIFLIFTLAMSKAGTDIATNQYNNLDDKSILYIASYNGFQEDNFNLSTYSDDIELINPTEDKDTNESSGKPTVDFAQEFLFSQGKSVDSQSYISTIVNTPDFYINTFEGNENDWKDYKTIISGFIGILIFIIGYFLIKGRLE